MTHAEPHRIADQLDRAVNGPAWHGPSIREALRGVTAADALTRPIAKAHSIWELVLHSTAWMNIVKRRVEHRPPKRITKAMNWPPVGSPNERDWRRAVAQLRKTAASLSRTIRSLSDDRRGKQYLALHGIVQHTLYHAGQIAVLKKGARKVKA
jgi:hypothetical protein